MSDDLARLARGWDEAAEGYERYYVPRFRPWVQTAVRPLAAPGLPDGPVLVPCCGTFPELADLLTAAPDRELVGIDLSAGMVAWARARTASLPGVTVRQGDASTLDPAWSGACAAVVSVFGLQQLPHPADALASWAATVRPGGRLSVVHWPRRTEDDGPFALLATLLENALGSGPPRPEEDRLVPVLQEQGLVVDRDERVAHPVEHPDAAACFDAHVRSGPLRPLLAARGEAFVADLRAAFLRRSPSGPWRHRPSARHLLAHRPPA